MNGDDRLDIHDPSRPVVVSDVEEGVRLKRQADEVGNRVLGLHGKGRFVILRRFLCQDRRTRRKYPQQHADGGSGDAMT